MTVDNSAGLLFLWFKEFFAKSSYLTLNWFPFTIESNANIKHKGGIVLKIDMNVGSFVFMFFLILAIFLSFLSYFEPEGMEFSLAGAIIKINGGVVGVRLHSGVTVFVHHVENIDSYRELIDSLREDSLPVEIFFRQTYYHFSKTSSMRITCASQDFSQPIK